MNWNCTSEEIELIDKIVTRYINMTASGEDKHLHSNDTLHHTMNVEASHCNGCELDLQSLLDSSDRDFRHDMRGIDQNINRKTGELMNYFVPRCAKKQ